MHEIDVLDARFGRVTVATSGDEVAVHGPGVPEVRIARRGAAAPASRVPIGTRKLAALTFTVGGDVATLRPSPGRFLRASYAVRARFCGATLLVTPCSPTGARLVRSRWHRLDQEMGVVECVQGVPQPIVWSPDVRLRGRSHTVPLPDPWEAAAAYAIAAAFGTGANLMWEALLEFVSLF